MEDQALKWWHVRWGLAGRIIARFAIVSGKIIGLLGLVAALCGGTVYLISPWLVSRWLGKADPRLNLVPISLSTDSEVPLSKSTVDRYGFSIPLPKGEVGSTANGKQITMVRLPNGMLIVNYPLRESDWTVSELVRLNKDAEKLLGPEILHSKFKLMQAAMSETSEEVKWWRFRSSQNQRAELLLSTKFLVLLNPFSLHDGAIHPIYSIVFGEFRGFQVGSPNVSPYDAHIDLFDKNDRHLVFDITGTQGHGQVLTQKDINSVMASIRPTAEH